MQNFTYQLRVSKKAKRIAIRVLPEGKVEVVLPQNMHPKLAHAFIRKRADWVTKQLTAQVARTSRKKSYGFQTGERIPFLGLELELAVNERPGKDNAYRFGETLFVCVKKQIPADIKAAVEAWFRRQAGIFFAREATFLTERLGVKAKRITVKNQKSLWGSCSKKGNLNFNWRLLLAPPHIGHYLVAHEVAHLKHQNHSKAFWDAVESICPQYEECDEWLKDHSHLLSF